MFVSTRSSKLRPDLVNSCETVVYEHKKPKEIVSNQNNQKKVIISEKKEGGSRKSKKSRRDDNKWNMKKLRYDIIKFGTSGFSGAKKDESKIALAVSLGAQPPQKKCINYKEILKAKVAEKQEKAKLQKLNKHKKLKKQKYKSSVKDKNGTKQLLDVYGRVPKGRLNSSMPNI